MSYTVWHFMSIWSPSGRRTQVHFHTLSWFRCFLTEKHGGKQKPEYHNCSFGEAAVVLTEDVELWIWKMSACLEMQSFSLAPWSTPRQTKDTPGTLWWDLFKLFGVLWQCCSPNCISQGRDSPHSTNATYIGFHTSNLCKRASLQASSRDRSHVCLFPPVPAGTVNSLRDVPGQIWQLSREWIGRLAFLPWHYSTYTSPLLSNKPQDYIF